MFLPRSFAIDAKGLTREVDGELHAHVAPRSRRAQREAGGIDRRPTDHGGHYIAVRFDGPADAFNHFAQDANFNNSAYKSLENLWAKALEHQKRVQVHIAPSYLGPSRRPASLMITYTIDGYKTVRKLSNEPRGKRDG